MSKEKKSYQILFFSHSSAGTQNKPFFFFFSLSLRFLPFVLTFSRGTRLPGFKEHAPLSPFPSFAQLYSSLSFLFLPLYPNAVLLPSPFLSSSAIFLFLFLPFPSELNKTDYLN
ncbi:hypothetical protein F5H01DRAFT_183772 [Linnemannia elongata]|nr:hypothetical protein F5H01DRAFT_183772 [Linnemannia elongata]